jgi:hypothetical protein
VARHLRLVQSAILRLPYWKHASIVAVLLASIIVFGLAYPDKASFEDVRRFQLHVAQSGVGTGALNATVAALRFFFRVTLRRSAIIEHTAFIHEPRKL